MAENETDPPAAKRLKGGKKAVLRLVEKAPVLESGEPGGGGEHDGSGDVRMYYSAPLEADAQDAERERDSSAHLSHEPELGREGKVLRKPRPLGFSLDDMNDRYALVLQGSKAVIYHEQPDAPLDDQQRVLTLEAFHTWFCNKLTEIVDGEGKIKRVPWSKRWIHHPRRRSYSGITFLPEDARGRRPPRGYLNLWSGFAIRPDASAGTWHVLRDHMLTNICNDDANLFRWVFGFFAHMFQRPQERLGTALVMRGRMGTGKTVLGEVMGSLIPRHYFLVDEPRYVTGNFNAHMASCLLLQADEAVWAGDKAAEGKLKSLVTAKIQQIEAKGVDPIRLPNFVRLIMTSNEDWVVPAGKDERRFCVVDVAPHCAQNRDYFRELFAELDAGGREALLADLLAFDLDSVDLGTIPRTAALLQQKIRSFDLVEAWWFSRLTAGTTTRAGEEWRETIPISTLYSDYLENCERIGAKRKQTDIEFGMKMHTLVPGLRKRRPTINDDGIYRRTWCYDLPPIRDCRHAFSEIVQQEIEWPEDEP